MAFDPVKNLVVPNDVVGGLQDPMILIGVPQQARVYTPGFECVVVGQALGVWHPIVFGTMNDQGGRLHGGSIGMRAL